MRSESGEYEELEWIRGGRAGQWIDTGIPIGPYFKWRTKVTIVEHNGNTYIGRFVTNPTARFFFTGNNLYFDYGNAPNTNRIIADSFYTVGQTVEVEFSRVNRIDSLVDLTTGNLLGQLICDDMDFGGRTFCVFYDPGTILPIFNSQSHYVDYINPDGSVGLSLVPARRLSDGEVGMYDRVSQTFFTNQGTGAFIPGPATGRFL